MKFKISFCRLNVGYLNLDFCYTNEKSLIIKRISELCYVFPMSSDKWNVIFNTRITDSVVSEKRIELG